MHFELPFEFDLSIFDSSVEILLPLQLFDQEHTLTDDFQVHFINDQYHMSRNH